VFSRLPFSNSGSILSLSPNTILSMINQSIIGLLCSISIS